MSMVPSRSDLNSYPGFKPYVGRASAATMKGGQDGGRGGDGSLLLEFRKRVVRLLQLCHVPSLLGRGFDKR